MWRCHDVGHITQSPDHQLTRSTGRIIASRAPSEPLAVLARPRCVTNLSTFDSQAGAPDAAAALGWRPGLGADAKAAAQSRNEAEPRCGFVHFSRVGLRRSFVTHLLKPMSLRANEPSFPSGRLLEAVLRRRRAEAATLAARANGCVPRARPRTPHPAPRTQPPIVTCARGDRARGSRRPG
jgi:hypothetical protein